MTQLLFWRWSAADLAKAIRARKVSSREVVGAHLDRIEATNGRVNALTVVLQEEALRSADEADRRLAAGDATGPLHGVPVTVKENMDLAGSATSRGIVALKDAIPATDSPHIAHLRRAGAIPIGRTNMPDFGLRWHTDNRLRGATLNPWDPARTPGGSSGGDAVAVATGMTPLGIGNDYGGSLRYPAQCCGITALKPSLGRIPRSRSDLDTAEPHATLQWFAVHGPMARHVSDLRLALDVLSQDDPRDPWWVPAARLGGEARRPVRVALTLDPSGQGVDAAVAAGLRKAAVCLADAGYLVEEVDPPAVEEGAQLWQQLVGTEIETLLLTGMQRVASAEAIQFLEYALQAAPERNLTAYLKGIAERTRIAREWNVFQQTWPLILGPVSTRLPFELGRDLAGADAVNEIIRSLHLTVLVNLIGLPSVATPVLVVDGLPQGVQLIGPRFHEDLCLDAAEVIERQFSPLTPVDPPPGHSPRFQGL